MKRGPAGEATPAPWNRLLIVGGPGSGKTTLARTIGNALDATIVDLDFVGYDEGAGTERPLADRLGDAANIARQEHWIAEGSYIGWTDALAEASDVIILLDPPWRVACYRILKRHAVASLRRTNRHPGLRNLWQFLRRSKGYYTGASPRHQHVVDWAGGYASKVIVCRTDQDVSDLVCSIHSRSAR